jgi:hypothetical protein
MEELLVCDCKRVVSVNAKCDDRCSISMSGPGVYVEETGYVNPKFKVGDGDYIDFKFCADCGKIQDSFPILAVDPKACPDCGELGVKQEFGKGVYCEECRVIFYPTVL